MRGINPFRTMKLSISEVGNGLPVNFFLFNVLTDTENLFLLKLYAHLEFRKFALNRLSSKVKWDMSMLSGIPWHIEEKDFTEYLLSVISTPLTVETIASELKYEIEFVTNTIKKLKELGYIDEMGLEAEVFHV